MTSASRQGRPAWASVTRHVDSERPARSEATARSAGPGEGGDRKCALTATGSGWAAPGASEASAARAASATR